MTMRETGLVCLPVTLEHIVPGGYRPRPRANAPRQSVVSR